MKTFSKLFLLIVILFAGFSCDREEALTEKKGRVSFVMDQKISTGGREAEENTPAAIVLSAIDNNGNIVFEDEKLVLLEFGQGFVTEALQLNVGGYKLTKFFVVNASNKIIYATPLEGSDKAGEVADALPLNFSVDQNVSNEIRPQVLVITSEDSPESFGYISFGFDVVAGSDNFKVRVKVEFRIGDIIYQDVNTKVLITGFDSLDVAKWSQEFPYVGPYENDFLINGKFHHYSLEVNQFGAYGKQVVKRVHLFEGRPDGPYPVTYILGGAAAAKKVSHYINYFEMPDTVDKGNTYMAPQYNIAYQYNAQGKVEKMEHYAYSSKTKQFTLERYALFTYALGKVEKITHYFSNTGQMFMEYAYQYQTSGLVSKITERNINAGVNSEVNFTYNNAEGVLNAAYIYSNGQGFQYEFFYNRGNIISEKTTRWSQLCSEGGYTYDKSINPLKHLGYVDYSFRNYSVNNKLTEDIQYKGCAFPTLIPEDYAYEYDAQGYPTIATTFFKSASLQRRSQTRYFYQ
jgi:hypothetical protein